MAVSFSSLASSMPTSATAGSPGNNKISENTIDVARITSGTTARSRRRRKRPTRSPYLACNQTPRNTGLPSRLGWYPCTVVLIASSEYAT